MRYKKEKHYPVRTPDPWMIWRFAQDLAADEMDLPRYQHKYCGLAERPVGKISEKSWTRLKEYWLRAHTELHKHMASWPRRKIILRPKRWKHCQRRGWTWSRDLSSRIRPPPRRRAYLPRWLLPEKAGPPRTETVPREGCPSRHEPEYAAVFVCTTGLPGWENAGPTRPKDLWQPNSGLSGDNFRIAVRATSVEVLNRQATGTNLSQRQGMRAQNHFPVSTYLRNRGI